MDTSTDRANVRLVGISLFAAALVLYLFTLAPTVQPGDGPELTVAARVFGVPHPPGYPLYTSIGRLFTLVPIGSVAARMNFFAALAGAAAVGLFGAWVLRRTGSVRAAVLVSAALATSRTFWLESTSAEVYALGALFLALILYVLPERRDPRRVLLSAYLWGLALTNHLGFLLLLPVLAIHLLAVAHPSRRIVFLSKPLFWIGLTPYAILPVRAALAPLWNWGDPSSAPRFLAHVVGRNYWGYLQAGGPAEDPLARLAGLGGEVSPLVWIAAAIGLRFLYRERRDLFLLVLGGSLVTLAFILGYRIHDPEAYFLPALMLLLLPAAFFLARSGRRTSGVAALLLLATIAAEAARNRPADRSVLDEHIANILATVEENAALVVEGDAETFGLLYATVVEGRRNDLTLWNPVLDLLPAGPLFARFAPLVESRIPGWKGAALAEAVRSGVPVYAASESDEVRPGEGFRLEPWGILFRYALPQVEGADREGGLALWDRYRTKAIERVSPRSGYLARVLAASYPIQKSRALFLAGRKAEGLVLLQKALAIGGEAAPVLNNVALAYETIGETERARELYARAEIVSADGIPTLNLARLDRREGRAEEAERRFLTVIEKDPRLRQAALLECGAAALERSAHAEASSFFERAARDRPWEAGPFVGMGEARVLEGDLEGARFFFRRAEERRSGMERLGELRIAERLEEEGRRGEAGEVYRALLAKNPSDEEALDGWARLAVSLMRPDAADSLYEAALSAAVDRAATANRYAWFLAEGGRRLDRALALAREARALEPSNAWFADTEGWALFRLGRFRDAAASFEEALRAGHPGADLRFRLGFALVRSGRGEEGRERLEEGLRLDPDSRHALEARAILGGGDATDAAPLPRR